MYRLPDVTDLVASSVRSSIGVVEPAGKGQVVEDDTDVVTVAPFAVSFEVITSGLCADGGQVGVAVAGS